MQKRQTLYKPKKEKIEPIKIVPRENIVLEDVLHYFANKIWEQRVFILVTVVILENTFLLVRIGR